MSSGRTGTAGKWIWLYPLTYLAHIAEEVWGGEGFAVWVGRVAGFHMTSNELVVSNAVGLVAMMAGVELVSRSGNWRWVLTTLAGIVLLNFVLHAIGSILSDSYSPGVISSGLLWLPLGVFTLRQEWRRAARSTFGKGLTGTAVFHALVFAVFMSQARL